MNRVCVLGDSHVAALKKGWDLIARRNGAFDLTFFAAPLHLAGHLEAADGSIVPTDDKLKSFFEMSSGGLDRMDSGYDHYILCGFGLSLIRIQFAYRFTHGGGAATGQFLEAARLSIGSVRAFEILAKLRTITSRPVTVIAAPIPGRNGGRGLWERLEKSGDTLDYIETFSLACHGVCEEFDAFFLPQPARTRSEDGMTKSKFARDAARQGGGDDDHHHMNAEYGAIVLQAALDRVEDQSRASAVQ